jgi:hypothetical protein
LKQRLYDKRRFGFHRTGINLVAGLEEFLGIQAQFFRLGANRQFLQMSAQTWGRSMPSQFCLPA